MVSESAPSLSMKETNNYTTSYMSHPSTLSLRSSVQKTILKKEWHYNPWERRGIYLLPAIRFYDRLGRILCEGFYPRSKGWPHLPKRLLRYSREEDALHKNILALRNSVYAHSDSESYSIRPWRSGLVLNRHRRAANTKA